MTVNAGSPLQNELKDAASRTMRGPLKIFSAPFLTVCAYYAIGVGSFSVMAAENAPDIGLFVCYAIDHTGFFAVAAASIAGFWSVGRSFRDARARFE
ncbi:hypothetical protein [Variovorax sp. SRS16]|uniref:hypothetical protein n=1 Tax=Variovorax sp. SRS16 TaxID=282217 RepID=UPI0013A54D22|nr:hypothetical protein [Variovorax sp. SRS16]